MHAVLRIAALLDAAVAHQRAKPFLFEHLARGVLVEELHLGDGRRTDEAGRLIELRADLHADSAGDAVRKWITLFLELRKNAWPGAEVVGAVDRDPRLDSLEVFEQHAAVDREVADDGELRERLQPDGLLQ